MHGILFQDAAQLKGDLRDLGIENIATQMQIIPTQSAIYLSRDVYRSPVAPISHANQNN